MMIDDANPYVISIHALRKESDDWPHTRRKATTNFNPRSP